MTVYQIGQPFPSFSDANGKPLDNGFIYIGEKGKDPIAYPIQVYWDENLAVPAAQPLRTLNGYIVRNGTPSKVFSADNFSILVRDKKGDVIAYSTIGFSLISPVSTTTLGFVRKATDTEVQNGDSLARDAFLDPLQAKFSLGTITDLRAYIGPQRSMYIKGRASDGDGGQGVFVWSSSNLSTKVAVDTQSGIYIAPNSDLTGASGAWVRQYSGPINLLWFGSNTVPGTTDMTAAMQAARGFVAAGYSNHLVFPSGTYLYTSSPNWAINNLKVEAEGPVFLVYTGTTIGIDITAPVLSTIYNVRFIGDFVVRGTTSCQYGWFISSIHQSFFQGRVEGCNGQGVHIDFSVSSIFDIKVSKNSYGTWWSGARPAEGIYLTRRNPGETTTACTFINPTIEGVSGTGIILDYASQNTFVGGTSEGQGGSGIYCTANSIGNNFIGIDLEANTSYDIDDAGSNNVYSNVNSTKSVNITGTKIILQEGSYSNISLNGNYAILRNLSYGVSGGTLAGTDTAYTVKNVFNVAGYFLPNKSYDSFNNTVSVPTGVATTVLSISSVGISGNRFYDFHTYSAGLGTAYLIEATIYRDGANLYIINKTQGAGVTLSVSGLNIQVTQISGISLSFYSEAMAR